MRWSEQGRREPCGDGWQGSCFETVTLEWSLNGVREGQGMPGRAFRSAMTGKARGRVCSVWSTTSQELGGGGGRRWGHKRRIRKDPVAVVGTLALMQSRWKLWLCFEQGGNMLSYLFKASLWQG